MERRTLLTGIAAAPLAGALTWADPALAASTGGGHTPSEPLVIGHRGASGYRPEHTLASYELAARMGADFIEPDVVTTKDGVLVCRHEPEIGGTTDVADHPEFASRRVTKPLDGTPLTGWFAEDFTFAELRTLRAIERLPDVRTHNTLFDGRFLVPTLQEVLQLRARLSRELGRTIGIYPETKHPTYFQAAGLPLERRLLTLLHRAGLNSPSAPVFVQSFETTNLKQLRTMGLRTRATQLLSASGAPYDLVAVGSATTYADLVTAEGLRGIAKYATGIGPDKTMVVRPTPEGGLGSSTGLVARAHAARLVVHPYTFRAENQFLPASLRRGTDPGEYGDAFTEQEAFIAEGVDGMFTDQADITVLARQSAVSRALAKGA